MEGRVAEGQIETFTGLHHAPEDRRPVGLLPQDDGLAQARIRREDARRRSQGGRIHIGAHEGPAVLPLSDERIDGVGAHPHVQHADGRTSRDPNQTRAAVPTDNSAENHSLDQAQRQQHA